MHAKLASVVQPQLGWGISHRCPAPFPSPRETAPVSRCCGVIQEESAHLRGQDHSDSGQKSLLTSGAPVPSPTQGPTVLTGSCKGPVPRPKFCSQGGGPGLLGLHTNKVERAGPLRKHSQAPGGLRPHPSLTQGPICQAEGGAGFPRASLRCFPL